jgi:acetyl esterase/lipase
LFQRPMEDIQLRVRTGGGYIGHATPGHFKYQLALQKSARDAGHDFSILAVSYPLAPHAIYPVHIGHAESALRYLVEDEKRDPSTVWPEIFCK